MAWSTFRTIVSNGFYFLLSLSFLSVALLAVHQLILPVVAWLAPSLVTPFYDFGVYGAGPEQDYISHNLSSPSVSHVKWDESCDGGFVLLTTHGASVSQAGPTILDGKGNLVWMSDRFGPAMNLKRQRYQGKNYLTFWAGTRESSSGAGAYYMLDETYKIAHKVSAVGEGFSGDLHEFKIVNDTALFTVYKKQSMDLSAMGRPVDGWVTDSIFQEVDIATGELLFEWKASDHYRGEESHMANPFAGYKPSNPFDFFHLNSIDKDSAGNYLISSRHLFSITSIDKTGEILWTLGGQRNDFTDLSGGAATSFKWQHDARWVSEEEGILTLFDNGYAGILHIDAPYSKALMIQLDTVNRTAKLLHSYVSMQSTLSPSQGSTQVLPETNRVFVGWGHSSAFSEFDVNGTLICETHFGASWLDFFGRVNSYRAQKIDDWIGAPPSLPAAKIQDSRVYVSWNGATEVVAWELQGAREEEDFEALDVIDKDGFESSFNLDDTSDYTRYRVAAVGRDGQILACSEQVEEDAGWTVFELISLVGAVVAVAVGAFLSFKRLRGHGGRTLAWSQWRYQQLKG